MIKTPLWTRIANAGSSLLGMMACAAVGALFLGVAIRIAKNSPGSSMPMLIIALLLVLMFASVVAGLIRKH